MKLEKGQTSKKDISVSTEDIGERSVLFTISKEVVGTAMARERNGR